MSSAIVGSAMAVTAPMMAGLERKACTSKTTYVVVIILLVAGLL